MSKTFQEELDEFGEAWKNFLNVCGEEFKIYDLLDWITKWIPSR